MPLNDITAPVINQGNRRNCDKKVKRTRLLLDARTELTDDELKVRPYKNRKPALLSLSYLRGDC
jgi:hypothetical protein